MTVVHKDSMRRPSNYSTYLLDFLFVTLFERRDIAGTLLGLLDLLPGLHLLLLEQSNSVGEQLGISLDTIAKEK
jgi:hypothetical protein